MWNDAPMPDYGRFCPVAMSSEVLADRWTPLIVRELVLGNTRFNDIGRGLPGVSRTLLAQRLRHLERCGVLETWPSPTGRGNEYHLTPAGKDLQTVLEAMGRWSVHWLYDEFRDDVEATTLMWWMHRRVDDERLPPSRVIIEFDHTEPVAIRIWLVLDRGEASVCMQHPAAEPDLVVRTTTPTLARVFSGGQRWSAAVRAGSIEVLGPPSLARKLPTWFLWSPWADDVRAQQRARERAQS
jgi:DNA-binding HxlR family transcriptional regulator